jgi:hypothetical protein
MAYDSLNMVVEWFFAGFTRVTDIKIDKEYRSKVYNVSIFHHPWLGVRLMNHRYFMSHVLLESLLPLVLKEFHSP